MTIRPASRRVAIALAAWLVACSSPASAQDTLARAKEYYASAEYEEALQVLGKLHSDEPSPEAAEVAAYQVFCLVALGQNGEATRAVEALVRADPFYHPPDGQVSPRIVKFFEDVRRPLLPDIAKQWYAKAKDAFARKDMLAAATGFDRVILLLDEMAPSADDGMADLRTLAVGFRDLSRVAAAPPAASPSKRPARIYDTSDADVTPPVPISRVMPEWRPGNPALLRQNFRGTLEIVIDEKGKVVSQALTKAVHPSYDPFLLKAATEWTFQPAKKDGTPVPYRYSLAISVGAAIP